MLAYLGINPSEHTADAPAGQNDDGKDYHGGAHPPVHKAIPVIRVWPFTLTVDQNISQINASIKQSRSSR